MRGRPLRKELYTTYTDALLLIMLVTPLALATIIRLALGRFINDTSNDVPVRISVALVNLDEATARPAWSGDIYVQRARGGR